MITAHHVHQIYKSSEAGYETLYAVSDDTVDIAERILSALGIDISAVLWTTSNMPSYSVDLDEHKVVILLHPGTYEKCVERIGNQRELWMKHYAKARGKQ